MKKSTKKNLKKVRKHTPNYKYITMENKLEGWVVNKVRQARDNVDLIKLENEFGALPILKPHWPKVKDILATRQLALEKHNQHLPTKSTNHKPEDHIRIYYSREFRPSSYQT